MDLLKPYLHKIRTPFAGDKIYKDECVFSFDTPDSPTGLYVCLNTFLSFGRDFVKLHHKKTGNAVFLHLKRIAHEIPQAQNEESRPKITKLAIGVEGGFDVDANQKKFTYEEINSIVILPEHVEIPLPNLELPEQVLSSVSAILAADSALKLEELQALAGTWEGETRKVSQFANDLLQLDKGIKIPPKGWKCERCDKTDNLWLNLSDGTILCGRRFFDGTGGNNHAVEHFEQFKYPLAVKLGTITPGGADVFSYAEDQMVEDPHLAKHLAHFGINIANMVKTEKSMLELEIDLNQRLDEWAIIQEEGSQLQPLFGPGYTGMQNLGNSCYLNSVMQVIFSIPEFERLYYPPDKIYQNASIDPTGDLTSQMAKLAFGLLSGKYALENKDKTQAGIKPTMFKNLIGKSHPEFSTKRQQDAQEFFLHLINMLERNNRTSQFPNAVDCFKFQVEDRIECVQSKKVTYNTRTEYLVSLPIPLDKAVNLEDVIKYEVKKREIEASGGKIEPSEVVRPRVHIQDCFNAFAASTQIEDFFSSAINAKSIANQSTRFRSFPDYLMVHIKKFTIGDDWVPKKLDVSLDVSDSLDLATLRGSGIQPGEELLPEVASGMTSGATHNVIEFDQNALAQLVEMGFPLDACKRALYCTNQLGVEAAMNWIMEHMNDPDFAEPFTLDGGDRSKQPGTFNADPEALSIIVSMGFTEEQALKALRATDNVTERAIDWIFSHPEELESQMQIDVPSGGASASDQSSGQNFRDGNSKYQLVGFISHMGTSTMCGHYVCHIFKEGRWVIYNDSKVAISEHPPKDLAYLYIYKRI